jgi:hypothetical protein
VGRAFSVCKSGLRIHPEYGAAHIVMAKLYLHQNMVAQAREAVERAVELNGPSRSSDLLLAEINISGGDFTTARRILNGFAQDGSEDQTVDSLWKRLTEAAHGEPVAATAPPAPAAPPVSTPAAAPPGHTAVQKTRCTDPSHVVSEIMDFPRVTYFALHTDDGTLVASRGHLMPKSPASGSEMIVLLTEIDRTLEEYQWGRLASLRIEDPGNQYGLVREQGMIAVLGGTVQLAYAAVLSKLSQCLQQLARHWVPEPTPVNSELENLRQ